MNEGEKRPSKKYYLKLSWEFFIQDEHPNLSAKMKYTFATMGTISYAIRIVNVIRLSV